MIRVWFGLASSVARGRPVPVCIPPASANYYLAVCDKWSLWADDDQFCFGASWFDLVIIVCWS